MFKLVVAILLLVPSICFAQFPTGTVISISGQINSRIPVMGMTDGVADERGLTRFRALSFGVPYEGYKIKLDMDACASNAAIFCAADQPTVGNGTWDCTTNTLILVTDADGYTDYFSLVGGSNGYDHGDGSTGCVGIYLSQSPTSESYWGPLVNRACAFDLNNAGGVDVTDLAIFGDDRFNGPYRQRSDYNNDGSITVGDLSEFSAVRFGGGSTESSTSGCGGMRTPTGTKSWGQTKVRYR